MNAWRIVVGMLSLWTACAPAGSSELVPPVEDVEDAAQDYALRFDGSRHYATTGTAHFPFAIAPQTLSAWVKPESNLGRQALLTLRRDLGSGVEFGLDEGRLAAWRVFDRALFVQALEPLVLGQWYHLAYSFEALGEDDFIHTLYVDGSPVATGTVSPNNRTPTSGWIGTFDGSADLFEGELDEVRVWADLRTEDELAEEVAGTLEVDPPALVGYWTFDENEGARALDRSGHGNHATLGDGMPARMPVRVPSDSPVAW